MANVLTAIRLLLALPVALLLASSDPRAPIALTAFLLLAIATDLADGPVARRAGDASAFGGLFDHVTDCVFVVTGMAGGVMRGVFPAMLPILVGTAFIQYVVDSYWLHRQRRLRASQLGRYNGILYFVPLCGDTLVRLGLTFLGPAVSAVCWLLVLSTSASIIDRLLAARVVRQTAPALRGDGTAGPSPR